MPIDTVKAALAMDAGLSAVCASCRRYWEARERDVPGDSCLAVDGCGGPLSGDSFHEYDGPLKGILHKFCFVCGEKARFVARVKNRGDVGVCGEHTRMFDRLQPKGKELVPESRELLGPDGLPVKDPPKRKSLFAAIAEVENYYAAKEGREPEV